MSGFGLKSSILAIVCAAGLASSSSAFAQDRESAVPGLKLSGDQPIQIESDRLEVDETKAMATFTGNVSVVQGPTLLKAGRMVVYYKQDTSKPAGSASTTGSTSIDRLEVDGKVYVKSGTQVGTGDSGTFDVDSNVLTLSGKEVVLSDGPNVLRGCKLTVHMTSGKSNVDGCGQSNGKRVIMLVTPGSQTPPQDQPQSQ